MICNFLTFAFADHTIFIRFLAISDHFPYLILGYPTLLLDPSDISLKFDKYLQNVSSNAKRTIMSFLYVSMQDKYIVVYSFLTSSFV